MLWEGRKPKSSDSYLPEYWKNIGWGCWNADYFSYKHTCMIHAYMYVEENAAFICSVSFIQVKRQLLMITSRFFDNHFRLLNWKITLWNNLVFQPLTQNKKRSDNIDNTWLSTIPAASVTMDTQIDPVSITLGICVKMFVLFHFLFLDKVC